MSKSENNQNQFIQVVRGWWWLLVLAPLLAGAISYYLNKNEPVLYEAEAQMMIGPGVDTPNPDLNSLRTSGYLAQTYKRLAATDTFLQSVIGDLKVDIPIQLLREMINLTTDANSLILTIDVQSTNPELAMNIANAVAKELLNISPANPNNPAAILKVQTRAQVNELDATIEQTKLKLSTLESDLQKLDEHPYTVNEPQYVTLDATEKWVKYLESEYQKQTSVTAQFQMGNQILNELIKNSVSRSNDLDISLNKTDSDLQQLVLSQIDDENNHLSALQKTLLELQQYIEGKPLDEYIQSIQTIIADLNEKYSSTYAYDITNRRFISDQIAAERIRLTNAEKIADNQQMQVFFRLSEEESRLSAMKTLPVIERLEKRRIISDQITIESDRLTSLQNSRAALSDALLQSWTNQVQITQLASRTSKVPSNFQLIILGASIAGLAAAMAFVIGIGYLDNSAQYVRDLESAFDIPLLGRIQTTNSKNISQLSFVNQSAVKNLPHSVTADDYRLMVVKLLHRLNSIDAAISENENSKKINRLPSKESIGSDSPLHHSILICGLNSMHTASEIAANLAVVLAQTGNTVLLVDLTLHEPANAKLIESDIVTGSSISLPHSDTTVELLTLRELNNLSILPISPSLLDPSGLFAPLQISETISSLKKYANYILIVGSNLMSSTETFVLASCVDGLILVTPDIGLKPDQVDSLMKNAITYKWEIIGSVHVKIRTSLQPFLNKQIALWFEKRGKILGKNSAIPEKEGANKEPNDSEGQSL